MNVVYAVVMVLLMAHVIVLVMEILGVVVVERADRQEFQHLLKQMLELVQEKGTPVSVEELVESDLVLPEPDITLEEAQELFTGEGLLPG